MSTADLVAYLSTVLVLMSTPGPSHLLMLSSSMTHGFRPALATAAGDLTANALQMLAAGFGLAAVLQATRYGFAGVKWMGVTYLIWLGVQQIRGSFRAGHDGRREESAVSRSRLWLQGFVTSAANPKAVVFFAALFPQFVRPEQPLGPQLLWLGTAYLTIDATFLVGYGAAAGWLGGRLQGAGHRWMDRLAGVCLVGAAILLGLKTVRQTG